MRVMIANPHKILALERELELTRDGVELLSAMKHVVANNNLEEYP